METPPDRARAEDHEEAPDFGAFEDPDELLDGERTRDDFLSVALQLRDPTSVAEIADWAGRGVDSAREYMRWFETMGLVRRASEDPEQYETNRSYLYWRRVDRIRSDYGDPEIVERLQAVLDELEEYGDRYDATGPDDVDIGPTARDRDADVEAVWEDVSRWRTLLERRDLLEDALDRGRGGYADRSEDGSEGSSERRPTA